LIFEDIGAKEVIIIIIINSPLKAKLSSSRNFALQNITVKPVYNTYISQTVVDAHEKRQVETSTTTGLSHHELDSSSSKYDMFN